ncbi:hypothetical protein PV326_012822 [Microctonus aethiopoides]|nr:hypothetical protein PV326_012822 [Microctonus aethiopoides]
MKDDISELHQRVYAVEGNIRLYVRIRGYTSTEKKIDTCDVQYHGNKSFSFSSRDITRKFHCDEVFPPDATQADVFEELTIAIKSLIAGFNVSVFTHGPTGSGKTYTLEGEMTPTSNFTDKSGIIPRSFELIDKEVGRKNDVESTYSIHYSFLLFHQDKVYDLLKNIDKNEIHDFYVSSTNFYKDINFINLYESLFTGQINRRETLKKKIAPSECTSVFPLNLNKRDNCSAVSYVNFMELPYSRYSKNHSLTYAAKNLTTNQILVLLEKMICSLVKKEKNVSYQKTKLAQILRPSLLGQSKIILFSNITPDQKSYNNTFQSFEVLKKNQKFRKLKNGKFDFSCFNMRIK